MQTEHLEICPSGPLERTIEQVKIEIQLLSEDMRGILPDVPYISSIGKIETLSIVFELKYTVDNASTSETSLNIKERAPATYYNSRID